MWFEWDGAHLLFTHTRTRQKFANVEGEPRVAVSIADPDNPYRFLEVRGRVVSADPDFGAEFYRSLQVRYRRSYHITDADVRVIIRVLPTGFVRVDHGSVVRAG
jgi:hypothetical protein